jgi:Uncharacterized conserved small protein
VAGKRERFFEPHERDLTRELLARQEDDNRRVRAELMTSIKNYIEAKGWTQKEAAVHFGVSQPRISEIVQGKAELFTVDKLISLLNRVGQTVEVSITKEKKARRRGK